MKDSCYIVFTRRGIDRMNKQYAPKLHAGEHVVKVTMEVPESVFAPQEFPSVTLQVGPTGTAVLPEVAIDSNDPDVRGLEERFKQQAKINQGAARLFELAFRSNDVETQQEALQLLNSLRDEGIVVRIEAPEIEPEEARE